MSYPRLLHGVTKPRVSRWGCCLRCAADGSNFEWGVTMSWYSNVSGQLAKGGLRLVAVEGVLCQIWSGR